MSKLHTLDITLEEGKELIGVRTIGNTVTIVYRVESEFRPIGFVQYADIEDNIDDEIEEDTRR